jgi:uncharacterized C2H2 Zn-finger protein
MAPLIDNETYDCVECDAKFQTYRELERHKATLMREGDGHIHCKICGTFFRIQYSLTEHIKQVSTVFSRLAHFLV